MYSKAWWFTAQHPEANQFRLLTPEAKLTIRKEICANSYGVEQRVTDLVLKDLYEQGKISIE